MSHVTIASVVKNEAARFLPQLLPIWCELAHRVRVVDNGSTDGTLNLLRQHPHVEVCHVRTPMDGNEWVVRKALFDFATKGSEWVVFLDADQVPASDFREHLPPNAVGARFFVYDMWDETHYREDAWWRGHTRAWWGAINALRAEPKVDWVWHERGWHSGHLPSNAWQIGRFVEMPRECSILHYGYATPKLRERHYAAYKARGDHLTEREAFHARTIKDARPRVRELPFQPTWKLSLEGL